MTDIRFARFALVLLAIAAAAVGASAQESDQHVTVTVVHPTKTVEEQVSDEFKARELRRQGEERIAAEEAARIVENSPPALLRRARTFFISSGTSFFDAVQLQTALGKRSEFAGWQCVTIDGWEKRNVADVLIEIDRPLFTYIFTYKLTHRTTGVVLASGKVTAFDGNTAAPGLAKKIVEEIQIARGEKKAKR